MRELKLEKTELKVTIGSEVYTLTFPTVKERKDLAAELEKEEGNELFVTQDFLLKMGLPKSVSDDFEIIHMRQILEEFNRSPK